MAVLSKEERNELRERLESEMLNTVRVIHFTQRNPLVFSSGDEDLYSAYTREMVANLAGLTDTVKVSIHDFAQESKLAEEYGVERVPCTILQAEGNKRIRHFGTLGGFHFGNLVQALIDVSRQTGRLSAKTQEAMQRIETDLHLLVLTDEMWVSGQKVSSWAYQLAADSPRISCDTVDLAGFPFMDQKYLVIEMPKVIVNNVYHFGGQMSASMFLQHVLTAAQEIAVDRSLI